MATWMELPVFATTAGTLEDHRPIVGDDVISGLYAGRRVSGKSVSSTVNSTYQSGGVAEMIVSLVPLMNSSDRYPVEYLTWR